MALALAAAGCSQILGIDELNGPSDGGGSNDGGTDAPGPAADCKAQRVVHLIAGNGGLAWFTLAWPAPFVITNFTPGFAYDDPANAQNVTIRPDHPLFARRIGMRAIWNGLGQDPEPTVFVAGSNETHTNAPQSIVRNGGAAGNELVASGVTIQASLAPAIPVLAFGNAQPYGPAPGAPSAVQVMNVDGAIAALRATGKTTPAIEAQLPPSSAQLASYGVTAASPQSVVSLASQLAFTANAFRFGLLGSVLMPAFDDDPHGAFQAGSGLQQRVTELTTMLDTFYRDLSTSSELTCGRGGNFLPLADNTVLIVTGDTPKNSFDNNGWPDGTPGNSNLMYLRSNGFTVPGWFGQIQPSVRTNFDPNTGGLDPMAAAGPSTSAAFAGALYAIARGDRTAIATFTSAPFDGVIAQ